MVEPQRTTFATSRAAEYFEVVLRELADNPLDVRLRATFGEYADKFEKAVKEKLKGCLEDD